MNSPEPLLRPRMPELDSLRGIAILSVVFYHGFFWMNDPTGLSAPARGFVALTGYGWLGVHLFFILSGFLITGILDDTRSTPRFFRRFYCRRALRILPAFYGMLLVLAFFPSQDKSYLVLSFFYLSNMAPLLHIKNTYPMFWSLAAEEHFYLVWPLLVWLLSRRRLLVAASLLFLVSPILRAAWFHNPLPDGFHGFTWLVLDGFAGGAMLALFVRESWWTRNRIALAVAFCALATVAILLFGAPFGVLSQRNLMGAAFLLTAAHLLFVGLLGFWLLVGTSQWKSLVNHRLLGFYGEISYGLYLIHWLVFAAYDALARRYFPLVAGYAGHFQLLTLRFVFVLAGATFLAWLSRKCYEERFLRLKSRFG
jgi:peptidoglycan/LPS O-acetylase OafA/YrhL